MTQNHSKEYYEIALIAYFKIDRFVRLQMEEVLAPPQQKAPGHVPANPSDGSGHLNSTQVGTVG